MTDIIWIYDDKKAEKRNRHDAIARIYAFGEVTSAQIEISEQVTSLNKEITLSEGEDISKLSSIQAAPGCQLQLTGDAGLPAPLGRSS